MPSNKIRPSGELMPPGLFGSTTIDCSACMEKANTRETAGATGVDIDSKTVSKMLLKSLMAEHWAFGHATLHFNRTTRRIPGASELHQHTVPRRLHDAAAMRSNRGIDNRLSEQF